MKKRSVAKQTSASPITPAKFELVVSFEEEWPHESNMLYADRENRFFLCSGRARAVHDIVTRGEEEIPLKDSHPSDFKQVTLKQACAWYGRLDPFSIGGAGTAGLLCKLAAKQLKD